MRKILAALAAAAGAAAVSVSCAAMPASAARPASCVAVTFAWQTATGHEADSQQTLCGTGLKHDMICNGNEAQQPGARFACYAEPR